MNSNEKDKLLANEKFSDRMRQLYRESGFSSVQAFADELKMSRQAVSFYLSGDRKLPDGPSLLNICKRCNCSADWLLGLSDTRTLDSDFAAAIQTLSISEQTAQNLTGLDDHSRAALCRLLETDGFLSAVLSDFMNYEIALACIHPADSDENDDELPDLTPNLKDGKITLHPVDAALFYAGKATNRLYGLLTAQVTNEFVKAGYDIFDL